MPADDSEDVDRQEIVEFLEMKGGIELLIALSDEGVRYSELEELLNVSTSTVYLRVQQAAEANLIEGDRRPTDDGFADFYVLTPAGKAVRSQISDVRLDKVFWELQERQQQFEELSEDIREWVRDEDSDFSTRYYNWWHVENEDEPPHRDHPHE